MRLNKNSWHYRALCWLIALLDDLSADNHEAKRGD